MSRVLSVLLLTCSALTSLRAFAQEPRDIRTLFAQLDQPNLTDRAAHRIYVTAIKDPEARQYVAKRLPQMIDRPQTDKMWLNAVRLAGQLKITETIPALERAITRGPLGGPMNTTFGTQMRLDDDAVAKALSQIGDSAIPAVSNLLKSLDKKVRRRAVLILVNVGSPQARKILQEHLQRESDSQLKDLIERNLSPNSR
jgi:HEAT repeat protein